MLNNRLVQILVIDCILKIQYTFKYIYIYIYWCSNNVYSFLKLKTVLIALPHFIPEKQKLYIKFIVQNKLPERKKVTTSQVLNFSLGYAKQCTTLHNIEKQVQAFSESNQTRKKYYIYLEKKQIQIFICNSFNNKLIIVKVQKISISLPEIIQLDTLNISIQPILLFCRLLKVLFLLNFFAMENTMYRNTNNLVNISNNKQFSNTDPKKKKNPNKLMENFS
eukprot:TRINITY_DN11543_c0_g6_i1.p1 TRINITY_DN11543_c0_g6~~TRINITY_DN11543_c0_g6_i1.p1  ORF type:complete len:221 (-),score=-10.28 TRINITY_DN11543_c0_g6_i1:70-732(-)